MRTATDVNPRLFTFVGGASGDWRVVKADTVIGGSLPVAQKLDVVAGRLSVLPDDAQWALSGVTSNTRYTVAAEKDVLVARQADIGRPDARRAALIPIRKNTTWWNLPQDERRRIFENSSRHVQTGLQYLPAIARRLHHCRDMVDSQPFDFLTWFDYAPEHVNAFEQLVVQLRATEEWTYVDREVDIRLER